MTLLHLLPWKEGLKPHYGPDDFGMTNLNTYLAKQLNATPQDLEAQLEQVIAWAVVGRLDRACDALPRLLEQELTPEGRFLLHWLHSGLCFDLGDTPSASASLDQASSALELLDLEPETSTWYARALAFDQSQIQPIDEAWFKQRGALEGEGPFLAPAEVNHLARLSADRFTKQDLETLTRPPGEMNLGGGLPLEEVQAYQALALAYLCGDAQSAREVRTGLAQRAYARSLIDPQGRDLRQFAFRAMITTYQRDLLERVLRQDADDLAQVEVINPLVLQTQPRVKQGRAAERLHRVQLVLVRYFSPYLREETLSEITEAWLEELERALPLEREYEGVVRSPSHRATGFLETFGEALAPTLSPAQLERLLTLLEAQNPVESPWDDPWQCLEAYPWADAEQTLAGRAVTALLGMKVKTFEALERRLHQLAPITLVHRVFDDKVWEWLTPHFEGLVKRGGWWYFLTRRFEVAAPRVAEWTQESLKRWVQQLEGEGESVGFNLPSLITKALELYPDAFVDHGASLVAELLQHTAGPAVSARAKLDTFMYLNFAAQNPTLGIAELLQGRSAAEEDAALDSPFGPRSPLEVRLTLLRLKLTAGLSASPLELETLRAGLVDAIPSVRQSALETLAYALRAGALEVQGREWVWAALHDMDPAPRRAAALAVIYGQRLLEWTSVRERILELFTDDLPSFARSVLKQLQGEVGAREHVPPDWLGWVLEGARAHRHREVRLDAQVLAAAWGIIEASGAG